MSGVRFSYNDGIGLIELDDAPTRNALHDDIVGQIRRQLSEWANEPELRGLVLTGANGVFSSGGSLEMIETKREEARKDGGRTEIAAQMRENARLIEQLRSFPAPTVAAIDGACVGAAIGWASACDLRVASDRAKFITAFAKVGLSTDFGTTRSLTKLVGRALAATWLLTSPVISADEALRTGFVSSVHASDEVLSAALELVVQLHPAAVLAMRANLDDADLPLSEALTNEAERFAQLL